MKHQQSKKKKKATKKKEKKSRIWAVFQIKCLAHHGAGHSLLKMDFNHPCGFLQHRICYDSKNSSIYSCYPIEQDSYFSCILSQST